MGEVLFPESLAVFLFHTYDSIFPLLYLPFHSVFEIPIMPPRVIVVGAGLSGLSAAHTIYLAGGNVVLLDKNNFMGGNSTKATSGINGALTRTQVDEKIADSVKQFYDDTLKSAREKARPDLIKVLTYKSAAAVEWLQDVFNLDLTLVSWLGGHSFPRTHRGHDAKFPGMAITYALMQRFEELSETSLLKKWRPDTFDLSTTNGAHATGDGHKMLMNIGANGIDMESVQVHPTGLVDPKDPTAKTKFLAAEALRGEGGLLLNSKGQRFTDELEHRDYVSGKMWEEKKKDLWPIRLVLNSKASNVLDFHTRHYSGRGLMKKMTGKELAKDIGCSERELSKTFEDYNRYAKGEAKDPFGKKYYHNFPVEINDTFHVALMEPVLHFTMGGIEIDDQARCLNGDSKEPFDGLFVCGELAGGVHGANRLGGSSLLGANDEPAISQQSQNSAAPVLSPKADSKDPAKVSAPNKKQEFKIPDQEYSLEEVAKHNKKEDLWIAVKGIVMNVTDWVDEHPGGPQALFSHMGKDASEEFEMLHDDEVIPKYAPGIVIGKVKGQEVRLEY